MQFGWVKLLDLKFESQTSQDKIQTVSAKIVS